MVRVGAWIALAILLVTPFETFAADVASMERALVGRWIATVGAQTRNFALEIFSISGSGDQFEADAYWGYADAGPIPRPMKIRTEGETIVFTFPVPTGEYELRSTAPDRFDGIFKNKDTGGQAKVVMKAEPTDGPVFAPGAKPTAQAMADVIDGAWTVKLEKVERERSFQIRSVEQKGNAYIGKALYGFADDKQSLRDMNVRLNANGVVTIDFKSSAAAHIHVRLTGPDEMQGVMSTDAGKYYWVRFSLTEEMSNEPVVVKGPKAPNLTFLYIAAANCPSCVYSKLDSNNPALAKKGFLNSPYGKAAAYREVNAYTYMDTGNEKFWPDDLKWIRDKTYVKNGTPRFVLVGDDKKVYGNVRKQNVAQLLKKIAEIKQLPPT
jgi:hypothetical protein